MTEKLII